MNMNVFGNRLLSDYADEEVRALSGVTGFKLENSSDTTLGENVAKKIFYSYGTIREGVLVGETQVVDIITIKDGTAYHFVYSSSPENLASDLPIVQKMADSLEFKPIPSFALG